MSNRMRINRAAPCEFRAQPYSDGQTATMNMSLGLLRGGHVTKDDRQNSGSKETFLNTAARVVGSTLGKLAAKTGLAHPDEKPKIPHPASSMARKKRTTSDAKPTRKPVAKKKVAEKKVARRVTKAKR